MKWPPLTDYVSNSMVVSLGPLMPLVNYLPKNPRQDGLGSNPRCLRRDVNRNAAMGATADRALTLLQEKTIDGFYNRLLGVPPPRNDPYPWGVSLSRYSNLLKGDA